MSPRQAFTGRSVVATADFEIAHAAVQDAYLPMSIGYVGRPAPLDMRFNRAFVGETTAGYVTFGRHVHIRTVNTANYHVNVPLSGQVESITGRSAPVHAEPGRTAMVFNPDRPAELNWSADAGQICLMVPRARFETELALLLGAPIGKPVEFVPEMDLTTPAGQGWLQLLNQVDHESSRPDGLLSHPLAAANLERTMIYALVLGQPSNYSEQLRSPRPAARPRAVRAAVELLEERPAEPWSPATLAAEVSVSVRSLQEGFQRHVGRSPMTYLREVRLDRVHGELTLATPESATVSQVAMRWGFTHLGRFATVYQGRFGHRPSGTLRAARG